MANQVTTFDPTPLAGITAGTLYYIQNTGDDHTVFLEIGTAAPNTNRNNAFKIEPGDDRTFDIVDGENCYVWSPRGEGRVVYSENPS